MNLREARKHVLADFQAGNASILKGPPGYGKTDLAMQLFQDLKALYPGKRIGVGVCFIATKEAVDAGGLPSKATRTWKDINGNDITVNVTAPTCPEWFMSTEGLPAFAYDLFFLILEEWGQGSAESKRAFAEILRVGGTPPYFLPEGSPRLALSNVDKADGVTKEFDFIIGRRTEKTVTGDVVCWLEDFANKPYKWQGKVWNVMPVTKAFAQAKPDVLFEAKPKVQGPWCNPRSLTMWDRYAQIIANDNKGVIPHEDGGFREASMGYIGAPAIQAMGTFLQFRLELPPYEDIVADPEGTPIPDKVDLKLLLAYEVAARALREDLDPIIKFVKRFRSDMSVTFARALLSRDHTFINEKPMEAWIAKNASLVNVLHHLQKAK